MSDRREFPQMGVRTCSLAGSGPFGAAALRQLAGAGFELAELSFNRPAAGVTHADADLAATLRREAEALGMALVAHAPDTYWLSNPDPEELEAAIQEAVAVVDGAAAYGARALVIHACPGKPLVPGRRAEQMDGLVRALAALALECERAGVRLAVETMVPGRLTSSVENLMEAVDRVASPWVGICLDTNHANLSQDLNEAVRQAGHRIVEFHLNDNHLVQEEHLFPYEGAIDWPAFVRAVTDIDYTGYMVMEPGAHYEGDEAVLAGARRAAGRLRADLDAARRER